MQPATETDFTIPDDAALRRTLREIFGFTDFRPHQAEIVSAILKRRDAFVVMPTGGGKSLCYQLPAHVMQGVCLVVSPLISLMKDQVDAAQANGLRAAYLNSSQAPDERDAVEAQLLAGKLNLLYVSPERFAMPEFLATLKRSRLSFAAIDEAHCISEWGHDFRPDYLNLSRLAAEFPGLAVTAFTATATLKVQQDIIARLGLRAPLTVRASFNRPNLFYKVEQKDNIERQLHAFVRAHPGEQGIVYRTTRKSVEATAAHLRKAGVRALPYHAGLDDAVRAANQDAFNKDEVEVMVATIAFGMGIDRPDVRFVAHLDMPDSPEAYYQQIGRAGRDGDPSSTLLLYGGQDIAQARHWLAQSSAPETQKRVMRTKLEEMVALTEAVTCRTRTLLACFGESLPADCGHCDNCDAPPVTADATVEAQKVLSAVYRTDQIFGALHIISVLRGEKTEMVLRHGHDRLPTFGLGADRSVQYWRGLIRQLVAIRALDVDTAGHGGLFLVQEEARPILRGEVRVMLRQEAQRRAAIKPDRRRVIPDAPPTGPEAAGLFEALRVWRAAEAKSQSVPPYVIFHDTVLRDIAAVRPEGVDELGQIKGVGASKLDRYGKSVLDVVRREVGSQFEPV